MKFKQYFIIIVFVALTIFMSVYSFFGNREKLIVPKKSNAQMSQSNEGEESYFKTVNYFILNEGKPFLKLEASELVLSNQNKRVLSFNPNGIIYRRNKLQKELDPIFFKSKRSRALLDKKEIFLEESVDVKIAKSQVKSDRLDILENGKFLDAKGNVNSFSINAKTNDQILVTSNDAFYRPEDQFFEYKENVKGKVEKKRAYEESISFTTDLLTLSGLLSLAEMKGNVTFKKENLDASSNQGSLYLENYNKKLKYYSLSDDVRLVETLLLDGKPVSRKAFSEKLEGFISEKKVILTGFPKVFQGKDVIKGNRITIRENVETVEVDDANTNITLEKE